MKCKMMALIGVATLGMSGLTFAVDLTIGADADRNQTFTADTAGTMFVVTDFDFTLSAGVGMNTVEDAGTFAVGAASSKGRNAFTGSSNGGSVAACGAPTTGNIAPTVPTPSLTENAGCTATPAP